MVVSLRLLTPAPHDNKKQGTDEGFACFFFLLLLPSPYSLSDLACPHDPVLFQGFDLLVTFDGLLIFLMNFSTSFIMTGLRSPLLVFVSYGCL